MFKRIVKISKSHSFFLFGARGTGQSTLLEHSFSPQESLVIDLLNSETENRLEQNPESLSNMIAADSPKKMDYH